MKHRSLVRGFVTAGCALGVAFPQVMAAVSDEQFNELNALVKQLAEKVQKLEQGHTQDLTTHEQDQQTIQLLQQKMGETQRLATNAVQKAEAASQVQPTRPVPLGALSASHNFTMLGDAEVQYGKTDGQKGSFVFADFAPIFLFRAHDNLLFEAGFDVTLQNGGVALPGGQTGNSGTTTAFDLSFAQLDYLFNDYVTIVAGDMLLPLGTYSERTAGWLNKFPDDPLPRALLPGSGIGVQLRGAVPLGESGQSIHYALYGANGPASVDGLGNSTYLDAAGETHPNLDLGGNVGIRSDGVAANMHSSPSAGGRVGWFMPWKPHYDIELGISGQSGTWDNAGNRLWSAAVIDAALHISPYIEAKGEYIYSRFDTDDMGTLAPRGWWAQAGYKLAGLGLELPVVNSIELVGRYDRMNDGMGTTNDRWTAGYVYYFTNTLLFEGDYEFMHSNDPTQPHHQLVLQLSYGF